jgi:hypothetical protein
MHSQNNSTNIKSNQDSSIKIKKTLHLLRGILGQEQKIRKIRLSNSQQLVGKRIHRRDVESQRETRTFSKLKVAAMVSVRLRIAILLLLQTLNNKTVFNLNYHKFLKKH